MRRSLHFSGSQLQYFSQTPINSKQGQPIIILIKRLYIYLLNNNGQLADQYGQKNYGSKDNNFHSNVNPIFMGLFE